MERASDDETGDIPSTAVYQTSGSGKRRLSSAAANVNDGRPRVTFGEVVENAFTPEFEARRKADGLLRRMCCREPKCWCYSRFWKGKDVKYKIHVVLNVSTAVIAMLSLTNLGLGSSLWVRGIDVRELSGIDEIYFSGISEVAAGGISSMVCLGLVLSWLLGCTNKFITTKHISYVTIGFLYVIGLNVAASVFASAFRTKDFKSRVVLGLNETLTSDYDGDDSSFFTAEWDRMQAEQKCCGALTYRDWFASDWAKSALSGGATPLSNSTYADGVLPVSCLLQVATAGTCDALLAAKNVSAAAAAGQALVVGDFVAVAHCEALAGNVTHVYVHGRACADYYHDAVAHIMGSTMGVNIAFSVVELLFIVTLIACMRKRPPLRRRIAVYLNHAGGDDSPAVASAGYGR